MGAAAPRKTAPRKAPVRKAPTPKVETDPQERRRRQVELFEQLRTRAAGMAVAEAPAGKTYTLGPAEGFDPPVVATYPTDLAAQVELDLASRSGDTVEFLRIVFGEYGFLRIVQAFNGQPDGLRLLAGLQLRLTDHFLGRGASEAGGYCGLVDVVGVYGAALRWDLRRILHLDLNDWLRGDADWRDLVEFHERFISRAGTACWTKRIQDPEVVAQLAQLPEPKEPAPPQIEGFGWHEQMLTKILNRLSQIVFTTAHADPAAAPVEPYPDYPHIAARRAARRAPIEDLVQQLIPGGGE